ncbi:MAG: methyltransferase family protein [Actinomycetota bacterium]
MDNAEERERGPVRFPPPLIYIGGLLGAVALETVWPTPNLPVPLAIAAGVTGIVLSYLLDGRAMSLFIKTKTPMAPWEPTKALVTEGPYRYSRNPMYLGMAVLYLGFSLAFGFLWGLALLPVVLVTIDRAVIAREESYLAERFGDAYRSYKEKVRRWL